MSKLTKQVIYNLNLIFIKWIIYYQLFSGRTSLSSLSSKEYNEKDTAMLSDKPFNKDLSLPITNSVIQQFTVTNIPRNSSLTNKKAKTINQDVAMSDVVQTNFAWKWRKTKKWLKNKSYLFVCSVCSSKTVIILINVWTCILFCRNAC